jgi:DNA-binding NarL/FixJ family response regulator
MNRVRVLLIDDHAVLRDGLKLLLGMESDLEVVGEAGTGEEGVALAEQMRPEVVVTDVGLPDIDGVEVTKRLRDRVVTARVLVLTVHDEDEYIYSLMQAGASGYLLKNSAGQDLVDAVRAVASGRPWIQPEIAERLLRLREQPVAERPSLESLIEPLTARELAVLRHLAGAASNREIAEELGIGVRTVETHLANIYGKLMVRGRTEAMLWAIRSGVTHT